MDDTHPPTLTLTLPEPLVARIRAAAALAGTTSEGVVTDILKAHFRGEPAPALRTHRTEERLLASVRALLSVDLATARDWTDLQARLATKGYTLQERGGGLALFALGSCNRICKASELGFAYADLMRRFGAPFPGHSHTWLARRVLNGGAPSARRRHRRTALGPEGNDDDPILIEPC